MRRLLPLSCLVLVLPLLAGCLYNRAFPIQLRSDLTLRELIPYGREGDRRVVGQALGRIEEGGFVVTCAGFDAFLWPAIPIVDEAIEVWKNGDPIYTTNLEDKRRRREEAIEYGTFTPEELETGGVDPVRFSRCDADGNFIFTDLPAEEFWVMTKVAWKFGDIENGGYVAERVNLTNRSELRLVLSLEDGGQQVNPIRGDFRYIAPWSLWDKLGSRWTEFELGQSGE